MSNLFEVPQLHLANPQKDYLGLLRGAKEFKSKSYLNNIKEISFKIYEYENSERNELYDDLEDVQLVEALDIDWYQIKQVKEVYGDDIPTSYKEITCYSLEDELISKKVTNLDGVFSLYNPSDVSKSIMHIVTNNISWNIGRIPSSLLNMYRVLSIDSAYIYSLLTSDISKSFGDCIFQFDTVNKLIDCYTLEELGELTDITINDRNLLKSWTKESDKDKIVTKMRCIGGTSTEGILFDIREVNFGLDTIANYGYFIPRMSTALRTAYDNQQNALATYSSQFTTALNTLKQYNADLNTLNNQLVEIEAQITAQDNVIGASNKSHNGNPPVVGDTDYTLYQTAITLLISLVTQKANKQAEITAKNAQITSTENALDAISSNVDPSNFFTAELLDELDCFTFENDDYVDETFIATSELSKDKIIDMKLELLANGHKELLRICRPQSEFKATLKNLWSMRDESDCLISYDVWRSQFKLGNLVTAMPTDETFLTVRIIGVELDYDDPENAEITFSNRTRLDDSVYILGEIQAQASRAYSSVQINKYANKEAASNTYSFLEFKDSTLNASLNKMVSDEKSQVETSEYGIKIRPWNESTKSYGLNQMWLNPWRMLFTNDGFKTANSAFGLLTTPSGTQRMGINTDLIIGNQVLTADFTLSNANNTITLNKDGAIFNNCDISVIKGSNLIKLNASEGITIYNGINKQFYVDINGNATFAGLVSGGSMNINNQFIVDSNGNLTATSATLTGSITGSNISSSNISASTFTATNANYTMALNSSGITFTDNLISSDQLIINSINIGWIRGSSLLSTILLPEKIATPLVQCSGISITGTTNFVIENSSNASVKINSYDILTSGNYSSYISMPSSTNGISASLYPSETYAGTYYVSFNNTGGDTNVPTIGWVKARSTSDERLKENFKQLDVENQYLSLEPIEYTFKDGVNNNFIHFGFKAQKVAESFSSEIYDIVEFDTDTITLGEHKYVDDGVYRLNDNNMHAMHVYMIQKLYHKIIELENKVV